MEEKREIIYSDLSSASRKQPYDAMVYLEGTKVIAVDSNGKVIAKGTAGTDDATIIQAAIDYGSSTRVMGGDYTISAKLIIPSNHTFSGDSKTTALKLSDGTNDHVISISGCTDVVLQNVSIDGNGSAQTAAQINGIYICNGSTRIVVEGCYVTNCKKNAICVETNCEYVSINGCWACNCIGDGITSNTSSHVSISGCFAIDNNNHGIHIYADANHSTVTGNVIVSTGSISEALRVGSGTDLITPSYSNVISNNAIYATDTHGICIAHNAYDNLISANVIYITGTTKRHGIYITNQDGKPPHHNRICDNYVSIAPTISADSAGIEVYGTFNAISQNYIVSPHGNGIRLNTSQNIASGNVVVGCGQYGIQVTSSYCEITGNHILDTALSGIMIKDCSNVIASGNVIKNSYNRDIWLRRTSGDMTGISILGNSMGVDVDGRVVNLSADVVAGETTISLESVIGLHAGNQVKICDSATPLGETVIISAIDYTLKTITATNGLTNSYSTAAAASVTGTKTGYMKGIYIDSPQISDCVIMGNVLYNHDDPIDNSGTRTVIRNNHGYVTENSGAAATVADGGTIAHGCVKAPTKVIATGSVAGETVTITSIDATNITVAIKKPDGSAGTTQTIYWRAEV